MYIRWINKSWAFQMLQRNNYYGIVSGRVDMCDVVCVVWWCMWRVCVCGLKCVSVWLFLLWCWVKPTHPHQSLRHEAWMLASITDSPSATHHTQDGSQLVLVCQRHAADLHQWVGGPSQSSRNRLTTTPCRFEVLSWSIFALLFLAETLVTYSV